MICLDLKEVRRLRKQGRIIVPDGAPLPILSLPGWSLQRVSFSDPRTGRACTRYVHLRPGESVPSTPACSPWPRPRARRHGVRFPSER